MVALNKLIAKAPKLMIAIILLITAFFAYFIPRVGMTTDVKDFFPSGHQEVLTYNEIEDKFGGAEYIMVAMAAPDIFTYESLVKISQITDELEKLEGVGQVRSLTSVNEVAGSDWGIEMAPLIAEIPQGQEELNNLRQKILGDPLYAGSMVSADGEAALMVVEVEPTADPVLVAAAVQETVEAIGGTAELYVTGTPVLNQVLASSMQADLVKLFPLVLALIALVLFLHFKTARGVLLPFVTVLISVIWTIGLMGILGKQLSPLNAVMPVILVSLGNAYGIYILARFREEERSKGGHKQAVSRTLLSVGSAVFMAGTTTIAGFASNLTSSISLMKDFGLFTAFGVFVALVISLILIPALLYVQGGGREKQRAKTGKAKTGFLDAALGKLAHFVTARSGSVLVLTVLVVAASLVGLPKLETDSNFFNFFDEGSQPKIAYGLVSDKFSGSQSVEVVIKGDLQEPAVLNAMRQFQDDLEQTGLVGKPTSVVNLLERANAALHDGDPNLEKLPESRELVAQYLLLLEMSDDEGLLQRFLTLDYQEGRIQALVRDSSAQATKVLFNRINALITKHFEPLNLAVTPTGIIVLMNSLAEMIIEGQIKSLIFSILAVFLIVRLLLKSWEGSTLSILLIFLTTLINFGLMGWLGISLDIVTVLISSIGIGVGIDYSIHVYSRYDEERKKGLSIQAALRQTITSTGKAIATNAGAVVAGFLILILSSFPPLRYFGSLVTITMLAASVGSLTMLPALITWRGVWAVERKEAKIKEVSHEKI